jgi:hypothetical protein
MNKLITLLFMAVCFTGVSQPLRRGSHVILIRNISTSRFQRVNENSNISILTTTGKIISGQVKLIKTDTLFFNDTLVRVSDIDRLYYPLSHIHPDRTLLDERRPAYVAGSRWQIICPPDTAYRNSWTYTVYIHNLARKTKNERVAPLDPLAYKNFLKWNVSKLLHLELGFSYERLIGKKLSWETEISGMLGSPTATYFSVSPVSYPYYNYDGISITTYPKYYFRPRTYLSVVAIYRYLSAKGMRTDWPFGQKTGHLQDQYSSDFGLSLRIGFMRRNDRFVVDYYLGVGLKYIRLHSLDYGRYQYLDSQAIAWYYKDHTPKIFNDDIFWPVFNLGIKIGRAFGHKGN